MKKMLAAILMLTMAFSLCMGCQKTPESSIVVGKNQEAMLEKAQVKDPQPESEGVGVDFYERLNAPKNYTADIVSKGGNLTVHVDADVELPDCEIPIYRLKAAEFTAEQVQIFADALFGENAHYVESGDVKTKAIYQKEIEKLRTALNDWDNVGEYMYDMVYSTKEDAEKALAVLLAKADNAPDTILNCEPRFEWATPKVSTNDGPVETTNTYMNLYAMPDDATVSCLAVNNSRDIFGTADMYYRRDISATLGAVSTKSAEVAGVLSIAEDNAFVIAKDAIARMQLFDFECSAKQKSIYRLDPSGKTNKAVYDFMFTRNVDGVMETYTNDEESSAGGYSKPWQYEKVHVMVDDEGVFCVRYLGPCELVEKVMTATSLIPFDKIKGIFEKMVVIVDNIVDADTREITGKYVITTVRLGLMSIREKDSETGLLIPVWDFLGYSESQHGKSVTLLDTNELEPFLTINAVDGSIIERGNGY